MRLPTILLIMVLVGTASAQLGADCYNGCVALGGIGGCEQEWQSELFYGSFPLHEHDAECHEDFAEIYNCYCAYNCTKICTDNNYAGGYCTNGPSPPEGYIHFEGVEWNCLVETKQSTYCVCDSSIFPEINITEINITNTQRTPCFSALANGSIKEAITCLYVGRNFYRDDNVPTMGYFFYLIVFGGMVFMFYLKHRSIVVSGIVMLLFLGVFAGEFPPEANLIYWGVVVSAIVSVLYGLFKNDE